MSRATRYVWIPVLSVAGGHRYFRAENDPQGRIGMADRSGPNPELTDDGLLWLDTTKPVVLGYWEGRDAAIPLVDDGGRSFRTGESIMGGHQVAAKFGMRVEIDPEAKALAEVAELIESGHVCQPASDPSDDVAAMIKSMPTDRLEAYRAEAEARATEARAMVLATRKLLLARAAKDDGIASFAARVLQSRGVR